MTTEERYARIKDSLLVRRGNVGLSNLQSPNTVLYVPSSARLTHPPKVAHPESVGTGNGVPLRDLHSRVDERIITKYESDVNSEVPSPESNLNASH